jgi:hypothetical protein
MELTAWDIVQEIDRLKTKSNRVESDALNRVKGLVTQVDAESVYPTALLIDMLKQEAEILSTLRENLKSMNRGRRPRLRRG